MAGPRHRVVPAGQNEHGEDVFAVTLSTVEMEELIRLLQDEEVDDEVLDDVLERLRYKLDAALAVSNDEGEEWLE